MNHQTENMARLRLKKGEEKRLRAGHLWVYSNEVDTRVTPLKACQPGQCVILENAAGRPLASAYVNPGSLICARVYSRQIGRPLDRALIDQRLVQALAWREKIYQRPFYRLCYGESDHLPGVVIDRYGDYCVVQLTTAGAETRRQEIVDALQALLSCKGILLRNDSSARELEGLSQYIEVAVGEVPEQLLIEENRVGFYALPHSGQKTGWFYDQRSNRQLLQNYAAGMRVLDVFCYSGAWGMAALGAGAQHVDFIDASATALECVKQHALLNGFADCFTVHKGEAFEILAGLKQTAAQYDIVVVDPPAFVKRRKDHAAGLHAYFEINRLALELLSPGGLLISASCSYHVSAAELLNEVRKAALKSSHALQVIAQGHQGPDHPVHPAMPETNYLKAFFCRGLARD